MVTLSVHWQAASASFRHLGSNRTVETGPTLEPCGPRRWGDLDRDPQSGISRLLLDRCGDRGIVGRSTTVEA